MTLELQQDTNAIAVDEADAVDIEARVKASHNHGVDILRIIKLLAPRVSVGLENLIVELLTGAGMGY